MSELAIQEQMNVVILGHVDHGKSTVLGRLLADLNALPEGKLESVKALCQRNARPFEYAFLLDALKDEQAQGITIDAARCFFKTAKRRYLVFDAPGHVEFLKNMITGASKAEAAFLVIDAHEGIQENSKRHGYIASMLGLRQLVVLVNKMDLVGYREETFRQIEREYSSFLGRLNAPPLRFIPVSAIHGANLVARSAEMPWYQGPTAGEQLDSFERTPPPTDAPFRFPVQDIYKFTEQGDERRIVAGSILTGQIRVGDPIVFWPSGKRANIASIERFQAPARADAGAGEAPGFTLDSELYIKPGELMTRADQSKPLVGTRFRANIFWMGRDPLISQKRYKLKIGAARLPVQLVRILNVLDASELTTVANKRQVDRHDVAECVLETRRPIAFDLTADILAAGRFVIVDNYEIAGAGVILENIPDENSSLKAHVKEREVSWQSGSVTAAERAGRYGHGSKFVVFTGPQAARNSDLAHALERRLFSSGFKAYSLFLSNVVKGLDADLSWDQDRHDEHLRRLGELARILTDSGQIFITALSGCDEHDLRTLELLNQPNEILVIQVGAADAGSAALHLADGLELEAGVDQVMNLLKQKNIILDYCI